jgi:hypothetical protein
VTLYQKFESWPEPIKPPFADIEVIGCCEQHEKESDFEWYRKHTWREFRDFLEKTRLTMSGYPFDIFQFFSLDPPVHRYYLKGALSALARPLDENRISSFEQINSDVWQWIACQEKELSSVRQWNEETFTACEYSKAEVADIIELVEAIAKLRIDPDERPDGDKREVAATLTFWKEIHARL